MRVLLDRVKEGDYIKCSASTSRPHNQHPCLLGRCDLEEIVSSMKYVMCKKHARVYTDLDTFRSWPSDFNFLLCGGLAV